MLTESQGDGIGDINHSLFLRAAVGLCIHCEETFLFYTESSLGPLL